jgi:hypothetical protein
MDALDRKACGTARTVKPRGPDPPTLGSSLSRSDFSLAAETRDRQAMVANKPGTPRRARSSRKAIAQGMPDRFGFT